MVLPGWTVTLAPVGLTHIDRKLHRVAAYRLHLPDWLPFDQSFKFAMKVGGSASSAEHGDYTMVCYSYSDLR
jgi:hypothetical protein